MVLYCEGEFKEGRHYIINCKCGGGGLGCGVDRSFELKDIMKLTKYLIFNYMKIEPMANPVGGGGGGGTGAMT